MLDQSSWAGWIRIGLLLFGLECILPKTVVKKVTVSEGTHQRMLDHKLWQKQSPAKGGYQTIRTDKSFSWNIQNELYTLH
jgi:hypothetical protein